MAWLALICAGILEVIWAWAMKASEGFTKPLMVVLMAVTMAASFGLLAWAMRTLPLGTAYGIWTGIGALGSFVVGIVVLGEPATDLRMLAAGLILSGIVLMKLATP